MTDTTIEWALASKFPSRARGCYRGALRRAAIITHEGNSEAAAEYTQGPFMMRAFVPARLGQAWVLLDAENIREILGAEAWLPIPGARAEMPGVIAWRGRAIPVVDLAAPFGAERLGAGQQRPRTLIAAVADSIVAVPVDAAREVHAFTAAELKPVSITELPYASAEAELFERVLAVIDLPRFVAEILGGATPELGREGAGAHVGPG